MLRRISKQLTSAIVVLLISAGWCAAQTGEHFHALKVGVQTGNYARLETGYFFGIERGLGSEGAAEVYGPAASVEYVLRSGSGDDRRSIVGFKAGFEYHRWLPFGCRFNFAYYTNGKTDSFQLAPEAGFTFDGFICVFGGVNAPLTNPGMLLKEKGHISILLNLPLLFKTFYDDRPPVKDGWLLR